MKTLLLAMSLVLTFGMSAQTDTEIHLFKIDVEYEKLQLSKGLNISNNNGYDNQPSFYNDNIVLFASTKNGQTDIAKYNIRDNKLSYINDTPNGSEYSPLKITGQKAVSSIRLDKDGKQLLYRYDYKSGIDNVLVKDLVIGYHAWINKDHIVSFVLGVESSLVVSNLKDGTNKTLAKNIGRSLHRIPNSNLFSYISKSGDAWSINSMNPETGESKKIINTVPQSEDMCWLINGTILMTKGNTIYQYNPITDKNWNVFRTFEDDNLQNITRITTNEIGTLLALVSELSPVKIVQKQLDAYNARDIDAFLATYTDDVKLYNYPNKLSSEGKAPMRNTYGSMFSSIKDLKAEIVNRTVIGNKVIDKEKVTLNGNTFYAIAIYEVENGLISKVTFIR
jgi:hypothetical protein